MANTDVLVSEPILFPLPTLPGKVHGIVGWDPCAVQCDGCSRVFTSDSTLFAVKSVIFNRKSGHDGLRLCAACWEVRGWVSSPSRGWEYRG